MRGAWPIEIPCCEQGRAAGGAEEDGSRQHIRYEHTRCGAHQPKDELHTDTCQLRLQTTTTRVLALEIGYRIKGLRGECPHSD